MTPVRPCTRGPNGSPCGNVRPDGEWSVESCRRCWLNRVPSDPAFASAPRALRTVPCVYLGPLVGDYDAKPRCRRTYQCESGYGVVCPSRECRTCADYVPDGEEAVS